MLARLAEAIDELELPVDGQALAAAVWLLDRLTAKVTQAVATFDAAGGWESAGATSMTAWLRHYGGQTGGQAGALVRTAGVLRRLPVATEAWIDGRLSGGQVQAVVANVRPATIDLLAADDATVVGAVAGLSVADTATAMQHWARCAEALVDVDAGRDTTRSLHVSTTLAGRVEMSGSLDAESGAVVTTAMRLATTRDVDGEPARTPAERRADAIVDVCRWFLDHQHSARGGRRRAHLNVVVDLDALGSPAGGRLIDGPVLDATTVDRLLCDSGLHRVITAGRSVILDYGATTRTVPAPLWAAVVVRDRHCRFPGCDRSPAWCEAHHVVPATAGGPTTLDNLVLLCTRHHHLCHRRHWHANLRPDGTLEVTTPDREVLTSHPPASPPGRKGGGGKRTRPHRRSPSLRQPPTRRVPTADERADPGAQRPPSRREPAPRPSLREPPTRCVPTDDERADPGAQRPPSRREPAPRPSHRWRQSAMGAPSP